jgi:hypothetical protein
LSESFQILKIQHIYKEFNREVDHLSKQDLLMDEVSLYFSRGMGDQVYAFERMSEL